MAQDLAPSGYQEASPESPQRPSLSRGALKIQIKPTTRYCLIQAGMSLGLIWPGKGVDGDEEGGKCQLRLTPA